MEGGHGQDAFEAALAHTFAVEGDFSDDAADAGGATKLGVTEALARAHGYRGAMAALPMARARDIYLVHFWNAPCRVCGERNALPCAAIAALHRPLALELFDTAVNCGVAVAARFLQVALNALNYAPGTGQPLFVPPLKIDGDAGVRTLAALETVFAFRGAVALRAVQRIADCYQGVRYVYLALPPAERGELLEHFSGRPVQKRFVLGWMDKRVGGT